MALLFSLWKREGVGDEKEREGRRRASKVVGSIARGIVDAERYGDLEELLE